jgi:hypothetical protein
MNGWYLRSNDGWSEIRFEPDLVHVLPLGRVTELRVQIVGKMWYLADTYRDPPRFDVLVKDHTVNLSQVLIAQEDLRKLLEVRSRPCVS